VSSVTMNIHKHWAWDGIVVKALRYYSEGPGIDPRWCHWEFFPWHPTTSCDRGRLSLLKNEYQYTSGPVGKTDNLPPPSADVTESGSLNLPEPSEPHRLVMGMLYLYLLHTKFNRLFKHANGTEKVKLTEPEAHTKKTTFP
jgi:hypothetical protein